MPVTPVYIICSPRPLVGKTLIARLLSEFLLLKHGVVAAFDINLKEPSLLEYLPAITETAEGDDTFGKMALMDRLIVNDGVAVAPVILFVADIDRVSARAFPMLQQQIPPNALITIDNEHVVRGELPAAMEGGRVLRISALPTFLKTYVDRLTFSFTGYLRNERDSSTELHQWIRRNYSSFRDLELSLLLQGS